MNIYISSGVGSGQTDLSAFDKALYDTGISNYNLLYLSSVIPTGSTLIHKKPPVKTDEYGHKLYVVIAQERQSVVGKDAWAGIGWVTREDGKGTHEGLFVEHHGDSKEYVEESIEKSLSDLVQTRGELYGPIEKKVVGVTCTDSPVCALVVAVYSSEGWN